MRHVPTAGLIDAETFDCWNKIGVHGDKSCSELEPYSHCRNCPVYSMAALTLLDREPADPSAATTGHFAEVTPAGESGTHSAIVFRIGVEWFALPTLSLHEVLGLRAIHSLPHRRNPTLLGLANVRGQLVPCVSIARVLTGDAAPIREGRLIVVRHAGGRLAFPVDEVQHIHRYHADALESVPVTVAQSASAYTTGLLSWQDRKIGLLDGPLLVEALNRSLA